MAVFGLTDKQLNAASMYLHDHLSQEEIAVRMDISRQSVASLLERAKATLAEQGIYWPDEKGLAEKRRTKQLSAGMLAGL